MEEPLEDVWRFPHWIKESGVSRRCTDPKHKVNKEGIWRKDSGDGVAKQVKHN